jgi:hypothetical protein
MCVMDPIGEMLPLRGIYMAMDVYIGSRLRKYHPRTFSHEVKS